MKLLIFGGTTEGRVLARRLAEAGAQVTVSVATDMGAEELADIPGLAVLTGRRDAGAMQALLQDFFASLREKRKAGKHSYRVRKEV